MTYQEKVAEAGSEFEKLMVRLELDRYLSQPEIKDMEREFMARGREVASRPEYRENAQTRIQKRVERYGEKSIPLYKLRRGSDKKISALAFLEKYYSDRIRSGNLYQFQLREMDGPLMKAIENYCFRNKLCVSNFIPSKRVYIERRAIVDIAQAQLV